MIWRFPFISKLFGFTFSASFIHKGTNTLSESLNGVTSTSKERPLSYWTWQNLPCFQENTIWNCFTSTKLVDMFSILCDSFQRSMWLTQVWWEYKVPHVLRQKRHSWRLNREKKDCYNMLICKTATTQCTLWPDCARRRHERIICFFFYRLVAKTHLLYLREDMLLKSFGVVGIFFKLFVQMALKEL